MLEHRCWRFVLVLASWGALIVPGSAWAKEGESVEIVAYNTYNSPPFVLESGGLASDLVALLNRKLNGEYRLVLATIPRARLVREILVAGDAFAEIVLFLNPRFVGDESRMKFLWSPPLTSDYNVMIFNRPPPATINAEGVRGMRFGAVLENRYAGIDELLNKGVITREYAPNERSNMKKLAAGKVDFMMTYHLAYAYMVQQFNPEQPLFVMDDPWTPRFTRHILVGKSRPELARRLFSIIEALPGDDEWERIRRRYSLSG